MSNLFSFIEIVHSDILPTYFQGVKVLPMKSALTANMDCAMDIIQVMYIWREVAVKQLLTP